MGVAYRIRPSVGVEIDVQRFRRGGELLATVGSQNISLGVTELVGLRGTEPVRLALSGWDAELRRVEQPRRHELRWNDDVWTITAGGDGIDLRRTERLVGHVGRTALRIDAGADEFDAAVVLMCAALDLDRYASSFWQRFIRASALDAFVDPTRFTVIDPPE